MLSVALLAAVVGFFIGAVGVGGILLIPPLVLLGKIPIHEASATALFTFFFTGVYGTWLFQRRGSIEWRVAGPICVGSLLFAYLGAWINSLMDSRVLQTVIAAVVGLAGFYIFVPASRPLTRGARIREHRAVLLGLGALCGLGSGITGAGGPLFSVPLMLVLGFGPLIAIGTGQVLQIASAGAGSIGNLQYGTINFGYAISLLVAELAGVYIGVRLAHWLNTGVLRMMVAILCIGVSGLMLFRLH